MTRAILCSIVVLGLLGASTAPALQAGPAGRAAPPVVPASIAELLGPDGLADLDGRVWKAGDVAGRVVLIDGWATWCAPCLAELPRLRTLHRRYADALVVIGLSLDTMPRRDFVSWLRRQDVGWPQAFDGRGYGGPAARRLGVDRLPASWLFDARGRLAAADLRGDALDAVVDVLVAEAGPGSLSGSGVFR